MKTTAAGLLAACGTTPSAEDGAVRPDAWTSRDAGATDAGRDAPWDPIPPRDAGPITVPSWVTALPLFEWYEIPNTALSSVEPTPRPGGGTGPQAKIVAWCGATLRRTDSVYMLGAAGGHGDYYGNEVNALRLNVETPTWVQLIAPSDASAVVNDPAQFYLDLRPSPTHTYYATHFIHAVDRMVVIASPGINTAGVPAPPADFPYLSSANRSFSFDFARNEWDHPDYFARFPSTGDFTSCLCVKHPVTEDIYYSRNYSDGLWRWAAASNTWTMVSSSSRNPWYAGAAIDPIRERMLICGSYGGDVGPEVRSLDGAIIDVTFGGLGPAALTIAGGPGVVYDPVNELFFVFSNGAAGGPMTLLRVDPATFEVAPFDTTGAIPLHRDNGVYNSVQYVPELRGLVIADRYAGSVKFVRTA